jgi:hypothetical protein
MDPSRDGPPHPEHRPYLNVTEVRAIAWRAAEMILEDRLRFSSKAFRGSGWRFAHRRVRIAGRLTSGVEWLP